MRPGIWHWQSPHPDWDEQQWWPELVSSYGIELGDDFLLFDPISVPDELHERAGEGQGHFHAPAAWPVGITAYAGREENDLIFWLPSVNAVVAGDALSDFGDGLDIQLGARKHLTRDDVVGRLRPLLDLPIELVLPAHRAPTARAALERVLI